MKRGKQRKILNQKDRYTSLIGGFAAHGHIQLAQDILKNRRVGCFLHRLSPKKAILGKPCCFLCAKCINPYFNWSQYVYHHPLRGQRATTVTKISIRRAVIVNRTCSFSHSKHSSYNLDHRASFIVLNFRSVIFTPKQTFFAQKRR